MALLEITVLIPAVAAIDYGAGEFYETHPALDQAPGREALGAKYFG